MIFTLSHYFHTANHTKWNIAKMPIEQRTCPHCTGKIRDPTHPERPLEDFQYFANANREMVKQQNPGLIFGM